jgi:hypothetical protein
VWERKVQITEENGRSEDTKIRVCTKQKDEREENVKDVVEKNMMKKH